MKRTEATSKMESLQRSRTEPAPLGFLIHEEASMWIPAVRHAPAVRSSVEGKQGLFQQDGASRVRDLYAGDQEGPVKKCR